MTPWGVGESRGQKMSDDSTSGEAQDLLDQVYDQLRRVAAEQLRRERPDHTLQPTALVHEAYLRLVQADQGRFNDRTHFLVTAARAIRRVLVDHARARASSKRGGGAKRLTLSGLGADRSAEAVDLLVLEEALEQLTTRDARAARVVELRYFGGLTIEETARTLSVGTTSVEEDWAFARSWLKRRLDQEPQ